ncbi:chaperonin containing TCP1 [Salpingoeca rosetta]|uniref:T-complex protein 1 subunit gamma n=1 Tax=Salpingoeca rosetta (strain ATCC 50818 / BSB-021) TaxID=946362 RepID=F2UFV4_SALR5|nr:chaperonin containing TCP1 [Salpingoeca rosetta]EGD75382.1 chaperonin containing TCP1 [Salpingoeca rosetta]|eukprot:XP_004991839.1 chaperonin containing TCP1 [Salpingoeca rosetta]
MNQQAAKKEEGRKVQLENIQAGKTVADVIRTCLGPRAMLKMLMDPMGGIVMTSDGNAILREIMVHHPAAKSLIETARSQDEEVGDGTTSVVILAGELLAVASPFMEQKEHPVVVIGAYLRALDDALTAITEDIAQPIDTSDKEALLSSLQAVVGTKMLRKWSRLACEIALDAVQTVFMEEHGTKEIDIKRYAKVEKIPGGELEDSKVLRGVMLNKDVTHSSMRRRIEKPRIILLDCNLEYTKGESKTDVEFMKDQDFTRVLQLEEEYIKRICDDIIAHKPDLIITEKGVSDLAQHYLAKHNITALRRVRKSDNNRIARACGATIVNRTDEIKETDIGTGCGLFEIRKVGDEYFTFIEECDSPKACTILLRGASKDILMEVERNLQDAMHAARNILLDPRLVPGGGATEMELSVRLSELAKSIEGVSQWPYKAVAKAIEVIPRTLIQNCGGNTIRTLTALRAKHAAGNNVTWGIDGDTGEIADMKEVGVWEPIRVKSQTIKTAVETAIMLLRIDKIVSGIKRPVPAGAQQQQAPGGPASMGPV